MTLKIDRSGTAAQPDSSAFAAWTSDQRVFISSVMGDRTPLRRSLANAVTDMGAEPVWFEAFGGRDDNAELAYLTEVGSSTIYLGILGRDYGRLDKRYRLSATHIEYREAERLGLPVSVWVQDEAAMHADQYNFLNEVRLFHTTGNFSHDTDLVAGVQRRLQEMAAEVVSPWAKLGDVVFRTNKIVDNGKKVTLAASVHSGEVVAALEGMRPNGYRSQDMRLTWAGRSLPVKVNTVQTTTTASRSSEVQVELGRSDSRGFSLPLTASFSTGSRTYSSDDLTVLDLRHHLFGDEKPPGLFGFGGSVQDFTIDLPADSVTTSLYQALFALLVTEALVESGRALRVETARVSPLGPSGRHVRLAWTGHTDQGGSPTLMTLEGVMPPH